MKISQINFITVLIINYHHIYFIDIISVYMCVYYSYNIFYSFVFMPAM